MRLSVYVFWPKYHGSGVFVLRAPWQVAGDVTVPSPLDFDCCPWLWCQPGSLPLSSSLLDVISVFLITPAPPSFSVLLILVRLLPCLLPVGHFQSPSLPLHLLAALCAREDVSLLTSVCIHLCIYISIDSGYSFILWVIICRRWYLV